jgi:cytochrome b involved in lipid metabolism
LGFLLIASARGSHFSDLETASSANLQNPPAKPPFWTGVDHFSEPTAGAMTKPSVQILTVEEVAKHNTKRDAWIIIDDGVYDITNFGKHHPGGAVIYQYAGLDATDAFYAFHYDSEAEKRLRMLKVGTLCSSSTHVSPLLQDFRALRKQVEEAKLMEPTLWDPFKCSIPYLTLYIGGYWLFSLLPYSMWTVLLCCTFEF